MLGEDDRIHGRLMTTCQPCAGGLHSGKFVRHFASQLDARSLEETAVVKRGAVVDPTMEVGRVMHSRNC
jgi:hypothetical protein